MAKLWQKGYNVKKEIIEFTVGNDHELDQNMICYDVYGSMAHAMMLKKIGVLTDKELSTLKKELNKIIALWQAGKFVVKLEDEDGHTAIENHLVKELGDLGKKIHTARSRNDQVVTMTRLYTKDKLQELYGYTLALVDNLLALAKKYEWVPMPGYTHMQRAMPTSAGMWLSQYAESLLDDLKLLKTAYEINDMNPLGSAAGFGVNMSLDRAYTTKLLGFKRVQINSMYVSYSRGKVEADVLFALTQIMGTLAKFANDVLVFSMTETGFIELPKEYCTGSSLMPQKKNGDVFELTRGKVKVMLGYLVTTMEIQNTLLSGYNRDSQLTKEPLLKGLALFANTVKIMNLVTPVLTLNKDKCINAFSSELFAADYALDLVKDGMPFRDAYREVANNLDKLATIDPVKNIKSKTHIGAAGNLQLAQLKQQVRKEEKWLNNEINIWQKVIKALI
ncbi:MAG: argininosuccinate lyase [Patescibacteria group bacterium]|jgi:argininosuccinate lyase